MAKLSQAEIRAKADAWAAVKKKIDKIEAAKAEERNAFELVYQAAMSELDQAYEPRLKPLLEKADAFEAEIIASLKAIGKPIVLAGELAEAVNETKIGNRVADPRKFYALAKDKFFECVTVGIAKAEKVIGKERLDAICEKPKTLVSSLRLKA